MDETKWCKINEERKNKEQMSERRRKKPLDEDLEEAVSIGLSMQVSEYLGQRLYAKQNTIKFQSQY